MDDAQIHDRIEQLVAEEQELWSAEGHGHPASDAERARLAELQVSLDRLWDLLRQRRAAREYGLDPDQSTGLRPAETVESYEQ